MVFIIQSSSNGKEGVISKAQLAQRARREREKSQRPPKQPMLKPSRRQQAHIELSKYMRSHTHPPSVSFKDASVVPCVGPSSVSMEKETSNYVPEPPLV